MSETAAKSADQTPVGARADVAQAAADLGFACLGVAGAEPSAWASFYRRWIDEGRHGCMDYLARNIDVRLDPQRLVEGAASVIVTADRYAGASWSAASPIGEGGAAPTGRTPEPVVTRESIDPVETVGRVEPVAPGGPRGRIAGYALGRDYHKVIRTRLHRLADRLSKLYPGHTFRCVVDTAPLLEREHAVRAGLGFVGKHTLLIHPTLGSYLLLGAVVTTLAVEPDTPGDDGACGHARSPASSKSSNAAVSSKPAESSIPRGPGENRDDGPGVAHARGRGFFGPTFPGCAECTRCIDACPTRCIAPAGYTLDASRCISYLTLEHRGMIDADLAAAMGDWLAGCDVCQAVCPYNHAAARYEPSGGADAILDAYAPRSELAAGLTLSQVIDWTEADRHAHLAGSSAMRAKLSMLRRNALIAAGNVIRAALPDAPAGAVAASENLAGAGSMLLAQIQRVAADVAEPEEIRQTAGQVLASLALDESG